MELLAIRSEQGKGVYPYKKDKVRAAILNKYEGCSSRLFKMNEEKDALEWAGVSSLSEVDADILNELYPVIELDEEQEEKVAELPEEVEAPEVTVKMEKVDEVNDLVKILEELGTTDSILVTVAMNNGAKYDIWLNDCRYLTTLTSVRFNADKVTGKITYTNVTADKSLPFRDLLAQFEEDLAIYKRDVPAELQISDDEILYNLIRENKAAEKGKFYATIAKPEVKVIGDCVLFDKVYNNVEFKSTGAEVVKASSVIRNLVINSKSISTVRPYRLGRKITDERFIKAIERVESDGIICGIQKN